MKSVEKKEILLQPIMKIRKKVIGGNNPVFFIAEIGQNHQGDINIAKKLIDAAVDSGADCVKFQKTDLGEKFTQEVLQRPYINPNSWGKTYGEHKKYLEFSDDEFLNLQQYANTKEILFSASPMDMKSLEILLKMEVPFLKVGSGDANNIQLIRRAAQSKMPLIISTGMQTLDSVHKIVSTVKEYHDNFAILHCVSSYPTPLEDVNLRIIELYQKLFLKTVIGYSGHEIGVNVSVAATVMGAKIIERHITLDRNFKGSDHKCSLLPEEFKLMVQRVKEIQYAMGTPTKKLLPSELECWNKLGKTIVAARELKVGDKLSEYDLRIKVAATKGIDGINYDEILGKILKRNIAEDASITAEDLI